MKKILLGLFMISFFVGVANASDISDDSDDATNLPRMASLRSNKVNSRTGPGTRYPISWVYSQKNLPVEIVGEFEFWREIKDWEGATSWVHKSMLTSKRTAKVTAQGENNIYAKPDEKSRVLAKVEDGAVAEIIKCPKDSNFCLLRFSIVEGWFPRNSFFGLYPNENI